MAHERLGRRRFLAAAGFAAGLAGCNAPTSGERAGGNPHAEQFPELVGATPEAASRESAVYRETIDSVVLIRVYTDAGELSEGSGFVYDDRHVVTNQHVVASDGTVRVGFTSGEWRTATIVGTDAYSDLAVLELTDRPAQATPLDLIEGEVAVAQHVLAIGNPFGFSGSVSSGIVSGVDRSLPAANNFRIPDAIQTDAAVNPGNSGGPLVTLDGEVAGIVNSGRGDNIGFAISAALMRRVVPSLIRSGSFNHSYMGVLLLDVSPLIAQANGLSTASGVYIDGVPEHGPAAGVLRGSTGERQVDGVTVPVGGDVVVSMDGTPIPSQQRLSTFLALATDPGDTIPIRIIRDGSRTTVDLTLGERPPP